MKKTGITNDRNIIVEMSEDEYQALGRLALAVEGKTLSEMAPYREPHVVMPNMATVIGAVEAFTRSKAILNELAHIIKHANETLVKSKLRQDDDKSE